MAFFIILLFRPKELEEPKELIYTEMAKARTAVDCSDTNLNFMFVWR